MAGSTQGDDTAGVTEVTGEDELTGSQPPELDEVTKKLAPLRVLVVEDSEDDTKLLVRLLTKEGFEVGWERVCTAEAMQAALQGATWDLILADHTMPEFSALGALDTLKRSGLDLPFIIVSGLIGEEVAIEAMKAGAHDYIAKGRTARLVPAIKRELREATVRRERREAAEALERINAELEQRVAERTAQLEAANVELCHAIAERQQREREFTTLVEHSTDMITRVDSNLRHIYVNPEALHLMGLRFEQVIGKTGAEIGLPPAIESIGSAAVSRAIETGKIQISELSVHTVDGLRHYEGHHIPEFDETGTVISVLGIARDITKRRKAEEALRESEERYRQLVELSPEAILVHSDDHIAFINTAGAKLFGAERPEEIIGRPVVDFVAPGYLGAVKRRIRQVQEQGQQASPNEEELLRLDGTPFTAEVAAIPTIHKGKPAVQLVARDITERRKAEQFREEYLSLISHDLRTPPTTLMGTADWLKRGLERQGIIREAEGAANILKGARRMAAMITDLVESVSLESGHLQLRREPADLVQLVSDLTPQMGSLADRQRILLEAPGPVPAVSMDRDRIERAITNLITNALKYSPPEATVIIRVEQHNENALVSLIDRGVGIPPEDLPRLFERHFRAKTAGKREGLGLGLYITRLIAEAHGGQVSVESELDKGSTFRLSLPLAQRITQFPHSDGFYARTVYRTCGKSIRRP